jgi:hypothetical protein
LIAIKGIPPSSAAAINNLDPVSDDKTKPQWAFWIRSIVFKHSDDHVPKGDRRLGDSKQNGLI